MCQELRLRKKSDDRAIMDKRIPFKGALCIIWCGVNRLGDSGAKVV